MGIGGLGRIAVIVGTTALLAGCQGGNPFAAGPKTGEAPATAPVAAPRAGAERDVEAPEVFSVTDTGLWDGRPSLGGVWVAHPTATDPERVIIRNPANGKSVIGALFRREREMPGPKLQVSSDAAAALGLLAGQPAQLSVVALRRAEAPAATATPAAIAPSEDAIASEALPPAGDKPAGTGGKPAPTAQTAPAASPAPAAPAPAGGAITKPYIQIGIFSVEANARRAADQMKAAGLTAEVKKGESQGKTFWRVLVGPASDTAARDAMATKVKGLGYPDAYAVKN